MAETAGAVELSWNDPRDPVITIWQYRQQAGSGSWGVWRNVPGSTASTTTHTVSGLSAEETYRFQVRAIIPGGRWPNRLSLRRRRGAGYARPGGVEHDSAGVGQELTPTLIDPDAPALAEAHWRWRRQRWPRSAAGDSLSAPAPGSRSGESKLAVIARTRQYRPQVSDEVTSKGV